MFDVFLFDLVWLLVEVIVFPNLTNYLYLMNMFLIAQFLEKDEVQIDQWPVYSW